ncbi:MAG TPA: fumarate reductase/succinate dehydrogenase flavoprotein subunit, partial [Chthoniobacterales bacterium]|nr:fumarate reductase/succinate dehydrogenase flavoprotein subunit [Chthoniobacterales bacterium]
IPYTLGEYLSSQFGQKVTTDLPEFQEAEEQVRSQVQRLLEVNGTLPPEYFHRELGLLLWEKCGMARDKAGLEEALVKIPELRNRFWKEVGVFGAGESLNQSLESAGRVADFLELGELLCRDALTREESCGGHFRSEHQTPEGEALRHDDEFSHVNAWKYTGEGNVPELIKESLNYEFVNPSTRSYK